MPRRTRPGAHQSEVRQPKTWEQSVAAERDKLAIPKLGIGVGLLLGMAILFLSGVICAMFNSPVPLLMGALVALASLFHARYRMIFVGYFLIVLLLFLAFIVICGNMRIN